MISQQPAPLLSSSRRQSHPVSKRPAQDTGLGTRAIKALRECGYQSLANLSCEVTDGVVILSGVVPSFYLKQLAQETVRRAAVARIDNRVEVEYATSR
jgi:osmotically-inducible protein OsmY